ncbi:MAG: hypothetical protein Fues2KO_09260 [Fuerstiella sp.]
MFVENSESIWLRKIGCVLLLTGMVVASGCSEEKPFRKETSKVTGQVLVDGVPVPATEPLKIDCHNVAGIDQKHPTVSSALTGVDGKFEISTYETGDGLPAGDYVLTFMWGKMNLIAGSYGGPDKLKDRYSDPEKSEVKLTVKAGEPVELGKIELSTKK